MFRSAEDRTMDVDIRECRAGELAGRDAPLPIRTKTTRRADNHGATRREEASALAILATRFPAVRRLVGFHSFANIARRFISSEPPGVPIPLRHGENFSRFLRSQGNAASIEYVADIAELEMACNRARYAADIRPLDAKVLSSLRAAQLNGLRLSLHPSVFLVRSRFPIVSVWERNRSAGDRGMIERWRAEEALVARPFAEVEVRRLPRGGCAFIGALSQGQTIAAAIKEGTANAPVFDSNGNLAFLIGADVVVGIRHPARAAA
jgi:putative DNA-binding protein